MVISKTSLHTFYYSFIFVTCYILVHADLETSTVKTKVGTFVGYVYRTEAVGKQLASRRFLGIPYAEPPVGNLRFQKPQKKARLSETFDATKYPPICSQQNIDSGGSRNEDAINKIKESDDCLTLDVYTPNDISNFKNLPVVIFIHGGGFVCGSPNIYPGDIFSSYGKVIVVNIAYRLSVWGFLSTGDSNLPGNYGLFDQQMAIQWVYDNIAAFGGDPELISLIGHSAGSGSVIIQSMNPSNKGLIKRAVAMSGSLTCPWAFNNKPLQSTRRLGRIVGCYTEDTRELADCLRTIPTSEFKKVLMSPKNDFITSPYDFVPIVDGEFIPENPFHLINGNSYTAKAFQDTIAGIDFMSGLVSNEGLLVITNEYGTMNPNSFETNRREFEDKLVPDITHTMFGKDAPDLLTKLIIGEYTNWSNPDENKTVRESFIKLSGDYNFNIQNIEIARAHAQISTKNTYMYLYDALPTQRLIPLPDWSKTPQHGDELLTMFGLDYTDGFVKWTTPFPYQPAHPANNELTKAHISFLSNFAYSGNPNEPVDVTPFINTVWPTYDTATQKYLTMSYNMSSESVGSMLFAREYNFWRNILPGFYDAIQHGQDGHYRERGYCEKDCDRKP